MSGDGNCTIESTVQSIGIFAFQNVNTTLTGVDLSTATGLTSIGNFAFYGCSALTSANIGSSVTSIGDSAFFGTSLPSITIPDSVTSIGAGAFSNCTSLTSATIGTSVTSIGNSAFSQCTSLTSIIIPNSVTSIGDSAFYNCSSLPSITIPNFVTSIGEFAFYGCSALTSFIIPSLVTSIGNNAFESCTSLPSIIIPNSVTSLSISAFSQCTSLTSATIGTSVTSIGNNAFIGCTSLTSFIIPNSVTSIGDGAFYSCSALTSATIGSSVTSIGNSAFLNCTLLTSVQIDNQAAITYLGTNIFNIHSVIPTNKTVLFYNTAHYYFLTDPIGRNIANYFSSDPSLFNSSISYSSYSSPACFNEDTKILSLNKDGEEEYIPIQNLRKGDLVKSYLHGYRKIDLIGKDKMFNDPSKFTRCMYLFEKTDHNDLIEDLIVTGGHSILVDQLTDQEQLNQSTVWDIQYKIDDKVLLLAGFSSLFKPITTQKIFTWYHFTLECEDDDQRFGVFANGVLVEIPSKNQFKDFNIQEI
jgi:hypothetical protein